MNIEGGREGMVALNNAANVNEISANRIIYMDLMISGGRSHRMESYLRASVFCAEIILSAMLRLIMFQLKLYPIEQ